MAQAASKKQARLLKISLSGDHVSDTHPDMNKVAKLTSCTSYMVLEMTLANEFNTVADRFDMENGTLKAKLPCVLTPVRGFLARSCILITFADL